jgi:hypothetical protein
MGVVKGKGKREEAEEYDGVIRSREGERKG